MDAVKFLRLSEMMCKTYNCKECKGCPAAYINGHTKFCRLSYKSPETCVRMVTDWAKENKHLSLFGRIK